VTRIIERAKFARLRDRRGSLAAVIQLLWPDGSPCAVGLSAFCERGQRLLGLGRFLPACAERQIELICFPLRGRDDPLIRLPGHRVRRFASTGKATSDGCTSWTARPRKRSFRRTGTIPGCCTGSGWRAWWTGNKRGWIWRRGRWSPRVEYRDNDGRRPAR
jgi:hypothetical protein